MGRLGGCSVLSHRRVVRPSAEGAYRPLTVGEDAERRRRLLDHVVGAATAQRFVEGPELLQSWFRDAERFTLPGATHLLMVGNPADMATALSDFLARHPVAG